MIEENKIDTGATPRQTNAVHNDLLHIHLVIGVLGNVHSDSKVLDAGHAGDACDVTLLVLRKYLDLDLFSLRFHNSLRPSSSCMA